MGMREKRLVSPAKTVHRQTIPVADAVMGATAAAQGKPCTLSAFVGQQRLHLTKSLLLLGIQQRRERRA
jgi:hypothetical protein